MQILLCIHNMITTPDCLEQTNFTERNQFKINKTCATKSTHDVSLKILDILTRGVPCDV